MLTCRKQKAGSGLGFRVSGFGVHRAAGEQGEGVKECECSKDCNRIAVARRPNSSDLILTKAVPKKPRVL